MTCPVCGRASLATSEYCADHRSTTVFEKAPLLPGAHAPSYVYAFGWTPPGSAIRAEQRRKGRDTPFKVGGGLRASARRYWQYLHDAGFVE